MKSDESITMLAEKKNQYDNIFRNGEAMSRAPTLQRDQEVGKGAAQTAGEYEEDQDRSVHRHQRIVKFRLDLSAFCPFAAKDVLQDLKMRVRITQLEPEKAPTSARRRWPKSSLSARIACRSSYGPG